MEAIYVIHYIISQVKTLYLDLKQSKKIKNKRMKEQFSTSHPGTTQERFPGRPQNASPGVLVLSWEAKLGNVRDHFELIKSLPGAAPERTRDKSIMLPGQPQNARGTAPKRIRDNPRTLPGQPHNDPGANPECPRDKPRTLPGQPHNVPGTPLERSRDNSKTHTGQPVTSF